MHTKSKMWTLDCEDYVKNLKNDSIFELRRRRRRRRRLRRQFLHLMPIIPTSSNSSSKAGPPPLPPPLPLPLPLPISSSSNAENFSWKDHLMSKVEKKNKISSVEEEEETATAEAALVVSSTRWNPTPEQLKALQEMYQRGVRTPSAEEIQLIAAKLRHFGRIEGKNIFYWFQNHKARERQKRRRHQPPDYYYSSTSTFFSENIGGTLQHDCPKQTSLCWKQMDAEQNNKKLVTPSNCSLLPKGSASIHETAVTESRSNGWIHLDEKKRRQQQIFHTKTAAKAVSSTSGDKILWADEENRDDDNSSENRVLQLFPIIIGQEDDPDPIRFSTTDNKNIMDAEEVSSTLLSSKFTPNQFYEFL